MDNNTTINTTAVPSILIHSISPVVAQLLIQQDIDYGELNSTSIINQQLLLQLDRDRFININNQYCICGSLLQLQQYKHYSLNGYCLRCNSCNKRYSITRNSKFDSIQLKLTSIIQCIILLDRKVILKSIASICNIDPHTVTKIYHLLTPLITEFINLHPVHYTIGQTIEVDETKVNWIDEYNNKGEWVIGIFCRDIPELLYLKPIVNRSIREMIPPIINHSDELIIVLTDAAAAYIHGLVGSNRLHLIINKKQEGMSRIKLFQPPLDHIRIIVNVNHIEVTWKHFRDLLEYHHTAGGKHIQYTCYEYMYRKRHLAFLDLMKL